MALKKICRCGKLIDYTEKMCEQCQKKYEAEKKSRDKIYNRSRYSENNIQYTRFYKSREWKYIAEVCKLYYKKVDIYSYYILKKVEYGKICHHVVEIKDDWSKRLELDNLIYLSSKNHNKIHSMYDRSEKDKKAMQDMLRELSKRYCSEFL